jgi:hypothetical protein
VATLAGVEALTNKTVNGLTFTPEADGFSIGGGDIARTLTVTGGRSTFQLNGSEPMATFHLPNTGQLVTRTSSDILENKTISVDSNTLSNINADELDPITGNNYGLPIIWKATVVDGAHEVFTASAPFRFRILDAWAISTSSAWGGGGWRILINGALISASNNDAAVSDEAGHIYRASYIDADSNINSGSSMELWLPEGDAFDGEVYVMLMRVD